jgi:hypothetical protein
MAFDCVLLPCLQLIHCYKVLWHQLHLHPLRTMQHSVQFVLYAATIYNSPSTQSYFWCARRCCSCCLATAALQRLIHASRLATVLHSVLSVWVHQAHPCATQYLQVGVPNRRDCNVIQACTLYVCFW